MPLQKDFGVNIVLFSLDLGQYLADVGVLGLKKAWPELLADKRLSEEKQPQVVFACDCGCSTTT